MPHTPPPWVVESDLNHPGRYTLHPMFDEAYNSPLSVHELADEDECNRKLIQAAPQMLDLLAEYQIAMEDIVYGGYTLAGGDAFLNDIKQLIGKSDALILHVAP